MTSPLVRPRRALRPLRVASVPSGHVYVRHLAPEAGGGAARLDDPRPRDAGGGAGQWWPPVMLEQEWVAQQGDAFDVFHLHFGFDARDPAELDRLVGSLRRRGTPFVFTVHDLRNPHHVDRAAHDAQLDVLVPAADALVTLTRGAADEIRRRWGRRAEVLPHPHVVPFDVMARVRETRQRDRDERAAGVAGRPFRVGVHLKSLRACIAGDAVVSALVPVVAALPDAVLQVDVHRDVLEPDGVRHDAALTAMLRAEAAAGRLELHVHDYFTDVELFEHLASLDVSVLPYRFGTHSGWLETCRDLGTTVVAPSCGYYADQGPVLGYRHDESGLDGASLAAAVRRAHRERPDLGATVAERRAQREVVAQGHEDLYRRLHAATDGR